MRYDYIYNSPPDPEADHALAKFFAILFWLALGLVAIVYVANVVRAWFKVTVEWATDMTAYVASFLPF
jgi:magnesium-transporting ATPase (P-type)